MSRRWSRIPQALWRSSGSRLVVLAPGSREPIVLEPPGPWFWELLATPRTDDELMAAVAGSWDIDRTRVSDEVLPFLDGLVAAGVVARR